MDKLKDTFADVVLPLALPKTYTYAIPSEIQGKASPGHRVIVQFGKKRYYTALIWHIHHEKPKLYDPKPIESLVDDAPLIHEKHRQFWEWLSFYYLSTLGDVMNAALPAGLKLESETRIMLHPFFDDNYEQLSDEEYLLAEALSHRHELSVNEVQDILDKKTVFPLLKSMIEKRVVFLREEMQEGYKPKMEKYVKLSGKYDDDKARKALFDELNRAPRQLDIVLNYFQLSTMADRVLKKDLLEATGKNYQAVNKLIEKGIFVETEEAVSRLPADLDESVEMYELSDEQQRARREIEKGFKDKEVVLMHGVTSSGKTEIYAEIIKTYLESGQQVLYLLPEIALTTQMIVRLKRYFGDKIGIYHSRFNAMERVEIWHDVASKKYQLVIGPRSALFLPFQDLGFIIVDEEHDASYKQFDPAPRYNARDAAIYLGTLFDARVLLGSATPSVESYYNTQRGKYALVELMERYGQIQLPEVKLMDIRHSARLKDGKSHISEGLMNALDEVLKNNDQAILFRNRRGYAPMLICGTCGFIPQCQNCDVSLTYHKYADQLKCHYCGYHIPTIRECPACKAHNMRLSGYGTERIEDELQRLFDDINVKRLDVDSVKGKHGHQQIINEFENHKINILVGTQMVTKGLDFEKVALVGILNADQLMFFPDFRSSERAFQLMVQVSGRAGRKKKRGNVVIQTRNVGHPLLQLVMHNNYAAFYEKEISERRQFKYPPIIRLIYLRLRHKDKEKVQMAANKAYEMLAAILGSRVYRPVQPYVSRVRGQYLFDILIKTERSKQMLNRSHKALRKLFSDMSADKAYRAVYIYADVDPY